MQLLKFAMSKDDAVPKLLEVFQQYGYEGATLSRLSAATGLGRASLYHHFPQGKEAMAAAVLNYLNRGLDQLLAPLQSGTVPETLRDRPAIERLEEMCCRVKQFYGQGNQACLLALLSAGEAQNLFAPQIEAALSLWIDRLAAVAIEAGIAPQVARERAEDAVLRIQGALVLTRGLHDSSIFDRVLNQLPEMLLATT